MIAATLVLLLIILELALWLPMTPGRKRLATLVGGGMLLAHIYFVVSQPTSLAWVSLGLAGYRVLNIGRYVKGRRQADHLLLASRRASRWLCLATIVAVVGSAGLASSSGGVLLAGLAIICLLGATTLFVTTQRSLRTTRPSVSTGDQAVPDRELPTLTVAIPARNETDDLAACLNSLVASTYPKLEILVLDDCSQNQHTPEIIRNFAHDGVRFIAGQVPADNWLAKNYAYQQLLEASSGDLLLFCGVDTRFQPASLRLLVTAMLGKQKSMMSLLPANRVPAAGDFASLLVQPSRYAWELMLPRRYFERPPVLSTAWIIKRSALVAAGGFAATRRAIIPERYLAKFSASHNDGYSFVQSDTLTGIASQKSAAEQRSTAIRNHYPQLHQRIELVAATAVAELLVLVLPFGLLVAGVLTAKWWLSGLALLACLLLSMAYAQIVAITYRRVLLRSLWLLPLAALYDIAMLHYSMWQYEFSSVEWKGRNVCIPVMRVIPHLPTSAN